MTVRHTLLAAGAVLVLGMAVYLLREVGKAPSDAQASRVTDPSPAPPPRPAAADTRSTDPPRHAALPSAPTRIAPAEPLPSFNDSPPPRPTEDVPPPTTAEIVRANPKLDAIMGEANRAYDHGDFDEAKQIAAKVLEKAPGNTRMLRILVSAECIAGEATEAQKYFVQLPPADRAQMRTRCDRYGVTLKDP